MAKQPVDPGAVLAATANWTCHALMKFLIGKGLISVAEVKQLYLDAAEAAESGHDQLGQLDAINEASAEILRRVAAEIEKRVDPRL